MGDTDADTVLPEGADYDIDEGEDEYEYLALPDVDQEYLDEIKQDGTQVLNKIPFTKIHDAPVPFDSPKRRCFLPGQKILVQITDVEQTDAGIFNPNLYVIHLTHGEYQWTIRRRYKHFRTLHDSLMLFRAKVAVSVPTKNVRERRKSFAVRKQHLPKFPKTPDPLVRTDNMEKRKDQLEKYLQNLLRHPQFRNHPDTLKFLEVSHLTFVNGLGGKWREGMMRKRAGGRRIKLKACGCFPACHCTATWNNRWLILKDTFIAYVSPKTGAVGDVMLMDIDFKVQTGLLHTGISHGLIISNLSRHLVMKCETHRQADEWCDDINKAVREKGEDFTQTNRYHSFAPVRKNAFVNWFIDGANYMAAVADAIEGAKEEIFITDWWLSPELYLKRPITTQQLYRLDLLLGRKAAEGIRVYVLIFKEMEVALGINSYHTKQTLTRQHPNIRVLRHPDGITLWSHHEKIVVIDQRIAFLGGIDLCFGRWDTRSHRLTDLGHKTVAKDLVETDEDSDEEALDVITEEPENDDEFVNINLSNNINDGRDHEQNNSDSDLKGSVPSLACHHSKPWADVHGRNDCDLNFNNNGNGEDAKKKERKLASRERNVESYPPVPEPFRGVISHEEWDSDDDKDTEESDVDMDARSGSCIDMSVKIKPNHLTLNSGCHGSYSNPEVDGIIRDEENKGRLKQGPGHDRYVNTSIHSGHKSELTVTVSPNGNFQKVERNSGESGNENTNESLNPGTRMSIPVIEVTDMSYKAHKQHRKPILRNIPKQMTFDEDDSDYDPANSPSVLDAKQDVGSHDKGNAEKNMRPVTASKSPDSKQREQNYKPAESGNKSSKIVSSKQDSASSASSLDSDSGKDVKSFKVYLQAMLQQVLTMETEENKMPNSDRPASVFQTGLSGLSIGDVKPTERAKSTSPRTRHRLRPPKLSKGLKHFGKGTTALDDDTAMTLASTGGQLPSANVSGVPAVKYVVRSDSNDKDAKANFMPQPKPTTPECKRKIYNIKEQFRKNKMMSVDVTDDMCTYPWRDSIQDARQILNPHELVEAEGLQGEVRFWIGKDYANFIYKDFVDLDQPYTDMIDRTEIPRMPWHDIGCMVAGTAARDVARHFIQRWNYTKLSKQKTNSDYPMILPKSYNKVSLPQWVVSESYGANCQILRSSCEWSAGIKTIECSIHEAYIDLILKAKHFIYIENQFFVTIMEHDVVENQIARALYERILAAHKKREAFRVYVVMPLLPAFEGELGTNTGTSIQAVTHWNYASICRGGKSLLEHLTKEVRDPFEYISFYGLRTHEKLNNRLITELVYVHSKLMIVDDCNVILGSANINDRSLLGKRDSEIAIVIEDKPTVSTTFNGINVKVGKFASDMRRNIFREHLGIKEDDPVIDVCDPVSAVFYKGTWLKQASVNTTIFEQVFNCVPTDKVQTYHQLRNYQKEIPMAVLNPSKAKRKLRKVRGNLVLMPLLFLSKENLGNLTGTKEGLMPNIIWT